MKWFLIALPDKLTGTSYTHKDVQLQMAVFISDLPIGRRTLTVLDTANHLNAVDSHHKTVYEEKV